MHIVLGGTSGIGLELANRLRSSGSRVLVVGRYYDGEQHGEGFELDLYNREAVDWAQGELEHRMTNEALESFIWSAGYIWRGNFGEQSHVRSMAEVNFAGALPLVQWAWNRLLAQETAGKMVVISSTSGVKPRADEAVYAATKHAQVGFARCLGLEAEQQRKPAQVLLCLPGAMKTPFWNGQEPEDYATFNDPKKVADKILATMSEQNVPYLELPMPHGSLV